ncbi:DEAD/DEAH box helicase [Herbiconiux sp. YIM B11900]|uniref:DEAD/DEAH box helicase n=1 Tax=Herbiconiux sp. YIM B11900 TaxID=3404131 RepID=UPI003F8383EC
MPPSRPSAERGWRAIVGVPARAEAEAGSASTSMGLQFEVRELAPRTHDRWRGPTSVTAVDRADADESGEPDTADRLDHSGNTAERPARRLAVRPVIRASTGAFVKANVTWGSFTHQVNRLNLDPEHHRWFAQFAALHRAGRPTTAAPETDWLTLDEFTSPLLWPLLSEAARIGIELTSSARGGSVAVAASAAVTLDAQRARGGALTITPLVAFTAEAPAGTGTGTNTGEPPATDATASPAWPAHDAGAIGTHGVYAYRLGTGAGTGKGTKAHGGAIVLAPVQHPLSPEQQHLLGSPATTVPRDETEQFFHEYYPTLRRGVEITSADASVELPDVPPPTLSLTARFRADDVLHLDWDWLGHRDPDAERRILGEVAAELDAVLTRFPPTVDPLAPGTVLRGIDAAAFAEKALPMLEASPDVRVEVIGPKPAYRELTGHPDITITTVETLKRDWFDLGFVININGYRVPFGPLFKALAQGRKKLLMVDKTYLSLDHPAFDRLRELLEEAGTLDEWETGPRISRHQVSLWADFDDLADQSVEAESWREAVRGLRDRQLEGVEGGTVPPVPLPDGVDATLRPYQKSGFDWLALLWQHRLGGVLADDMGLGKTLQTLALFTHARNSGETRPFLVVAPTSVVANWADEGARFTPGLRMRTVTATQAKGRSTSAGSLAELARGADVVVTSYALFRLDAEAYQSIRWAGLVLDEAQFVKNHTSRLHACARELDVDFRLAITGTPLENTLMELWALFDIVAPGLFPSARRFAEQYQRPIERGLDPSLLPRLRRRIHPFLLRRTKEAVAPELPEKQEQVLQVELAPAHRHLYDTVLQRERQKLFGLIEDLDRNRFIVFRSLTLLRMLSLDATLIDEAHENIPSSKLDVLVEHLEEVVAEGHRSLVFSQFTSYLALVAARLDAEGIAYEYLDGSTRRRPEVIERFKAGEAPVFLISLKAGGFGLTLTEADYVYLLDPWWNPASEAQAIDRTHRIGQTRPVNVYRLVATNTIEEKVMQLKEHKARLFDAVFDDAAFARAFTADDIRALLA